VRQHSRSPAHSHQGGHCCVDSRTLAGDPFGYAAGRQRIKRHTHEEELEDIAQEEARLGTNDAL
jgi:hypothetical protein